MSEYILTVKFAAPGTTYVDPKDGKVSRSSVGHVWLEVRGRGQSLDSAPLLSTGWNMGDSKLKAGLDNRSITDWKAYRESPSHFINSLSIGINREQLQKLQAYPELAATGKIAGFRSVEPYQGGVLGIGGSIGDILGKPPRNTDTAYNILTNSCIDYSGQGLAHIGLAGKNFDGNPQLMPHRQIKDFLSEMATHNQSGITVRLDGKTHTLQPGENVSQFWEKIAPNWDYVPYYMQNQNTGIQETMYAQSQFNQVDTDKEASPFLAFATQNPASIEEIRQFGDAVQDYGNQLKDQEMQLAAEQSRSRGMTISM